MTKLDWQKTGWVDADPARVIDVDREYTKPSSAIKKSKRVQKRRGSGKKAEHGLKNAKNATSVAIQPLIIPLREAQLVASILKDLGRTLPKKRNRLNNVFRGLIAEGIITSDGSLNKRHPVILQWLEKVD